MRGGRKNTNKKLADGAGGGDESTAMIRGEKIDRLKNEGESIRVQLEKEESGKRFFNERETSRGCQTRYCRNERGNFADIRKKKDALITKGLQNHLVSEGGGKGVTAMGALKRWNAQRLRGKEGEGERDKAAVIENFIEKV